jgi:hypothetical protein
MTQRARILIGLAILIVLAGIIAGVDLLRRAGGRATAEGEPTVAAGSIPIRLDGRLAGSFAPADLERLAKVSFVDAEENKPQDGWLLRDVILLYVRPDSLTPESVVTVSSSSRKKSAQLTWAQVEQAENYVMLDLSNRGTLKLVSRLPALDTRDEWVQDVDGIEIAGP